MFESYGQKHVIFTFYRRFHELLPTVLGSSRISRARKTTYLFESFDQKLVIFAFYGHSHELLPTILGFHGDLHGL